MINPVDAIKQLNAAKAQLEQFSDFAKLAAELATIDADGDGKADIAEFVALAPNLMKKFDDLQKSAEYQAMKKEVDDAIALVGADIAVIRAKVGK